MVTQQIEKLLILQDRDQAVRRLLLQLETIPREIQGCQAEIEAEKEALADSKATLQGLEVQRNNLDVQVGSAEEQIAKYKTQQLQVKKNEEFQALTHEIEMLQGKISAWEEAEIGLMLEIDEEKEVFTKRESVFDDAVAKIQTRIANLENKLGEYQNQLESAKISLEEAKQPVEARFFTAYDRLAARIKLPVVVPLEQQKCKGCHLRVSNENSELARKGEELTTCDNCGRIIYLAS